MARTPQRFTFIFSVQGSRVMIVGARSHDVAVSLAQANLPPGIVTGGEVYLSPAEAALTLPSARVIAA